MSRFIELEVKSSSSISRKIFGLAYIIGISAYTETTCHLDVSEGASMYTYTINHSYEEVKKLLQGK
jgi:hypothetical protein